MPRDHEAMVRQRRLASEIKRQRVLAALRAAEERGESPSLSSLARQAGVDRNWFYRHDDVRADVERVAAEVLAGIERRGLATARKTAASKRAELANAKERSRRLEAQLTALEARLSDVLGDEYLRDLPVEDRAALMTSRESEAELARLHVEINELREEVRCRDEELEASRSNVRELTRLLNRPRVDSPVQRADSVHWEGDDRG
jgi:hypothetical protein